MTESLQHRGPDAFGVKIEAEGQLGIGHTRLRLVDLDVRSDQPMNINDCTISFNGEIYNHKKIRRELEENESVFDTTSDTEVILRTIKKMGINSALNKFNGCFAFILYDKNNKHLYVARDPIGKKQVVYCHAQNGDWVFASEVKAIKHHPYVKIEPNIDRFISDLIFKFFSDKKETYFKKKQ